MKKLIAVGATAALMLAAASPAFAQDAVVGDDGVATGGDVEFLDASQVQVAVGLQFGDAVAVADDDSSAHATNSLHIDQFQFNGGF